MGAASTIDWSKYSSPAASGNGQIDFSKYAGQAEPGAREIPVIPSANLNSPPSVMDQDPRAAIASTLGRELKSFGQTIGGAIPIPFVQQGILQPFMAPPQTDEERKTTQEHPVVGRVATGLGRLLVDPVKNAAEWYGNVAKGRVPNAYEQGLSVAPEAMGSGAGNVVLGKAMSSLPEAATRTIRGVDSAIANASIPSRQLEAKHFEAIENAYGNRPIDLSRIGPKAQAIADRMTENKAAAVPGPVQTILDKVAGGGQPKIAGMDAAEFQRRSPEAYQRMVDAGAIQPAQPMTLLQMRHLRTDLNNMLFDGNIPDTFAGPLKDLAKSIQGEIVKALPNQTAKNWYLATNKEASRVYATQGLADKAGQILPIVGKPIVKPIVGGMVRSILNRDIGPVTPPPGAIESVMQAAKDGTISPGKATTILSNMGVSAKVNQPYWKAKTYPDTLGGNE